MLKALQIGRDASLLKTRGSVLETLGLRVISSADVEEALERIESTHLDLAILCHTVSPGDRNAIAAAMRRRHPAAPVVLVSRDRQGANAQAEGVDAVLPSDPEKLVRGLRRMLKLPVEMRPQRGSSPPTGK